MVWPGPAWCDRSSGWPGCFAGRTAADFLFLSLSLSLRVEIGWGWIGFDGFWNPFVKSSGEKLQEGGALCGMAMCRMQQKKHNSW